MSHSLTSCLCIQGTGDAAPDGREKSDAQEKVSPFEEDKIQEMKVGEESDPAKANGRGLLNGMDRDCKDYKYAALIVCFVFLYAGMYSYDN